MRASRAAWSSGAAAMGGAGDCATSMRAKTARPASAGSRQSGKIRRRAWGIGRVVLAPVSRKQGEARKKRIVSLAVLWPHLFLPVLHQVLLFVYDQESQVQE